MGIPEMALIVKINNLMHKRISARTEREILSIGTDINILRDSVQIGTSTVARASAATI